MKLVFQLTRQLMSGAPVLDNDFAFIVNINYVAKFQPDSIILLNGISLPVNTFLSKEIQQGISQNEYGEMGTNEYLRNYIQCRFSIY